MDLEEVYATNRLITVYFIISKHWRSADEDEKEDVDASHGTSWSSESRVGLVEC